MGLGGGYSLCIVFYHFWAARAGIFKQGYLAVDFFFVLSGFLLMRTCESGKYQSGGQYVVHLLKRYWPVTSIFLVVYWLKKFLKMGISVRWGIHLIYEILYLHILGIASEDYLFSAIWYLPVLIFISGIYFELYRTNKSVLKGVLLPIVILLSYSYLFAQYGDLSDFRAIGAGNYFVKGIYRGAGGIGIGCLLYEAMPFMKEFCQKIRSGIILIIEFFVTFLVIGIVFLPLGSGTDILILPCSCILIANCYMEIGMVYRIAEFLPVKYIGKCSLYIYLTQGLAIGLTPYVVKLLFGITNLNIWRVEAGIVLLVMTVGIAVFFQYIAIPALFWTIRKFFYRKA